MTLDGGFMHRGLFRITDPPRLLLLVVLVAVSALCAAQSTPIPQPTVPPTPVITIDSPILSEPHSVVYDALSDLYLVSSENQPAGDNNGFISRVAPDGRILNLKWIEGGWGKSTLDTPRGLALGSDLLHVADGNSVQSFDRRTGRAISSVTIPEATSLEFITVHRDGRLFVSDSGARAADPESTTTLSLAAVYEVSGIGLAREFLSAAEFPNVRGLVTDEDALYFVEGSDIVRYDFAGEATQRFTGPGGALFGLTRTPNGEFLTTIPGDGLLLLWDRESGFRTVAGSIESNTSPGWDTRRGRAVVANRELGVIRFITVKPE
jgi:WD40 repeat protein